MTVQDLIDFLEKLEDKSLPIGLETNTFKVLETDDILRYVEKTFKNPLYEELTEELLHLHYAILDKNREKDKKNFKIIHKQRDQLEETVTYNYVVFKAAYLKP